jgi:arginyl-tRNA synthetase
MNLTELTCVEINHYLNNSTKFENLKLQAEWLEQPKDANHGDMALPCFHLSRVLGRDPKSISLQLSEYLKSCLASSSALNKLAPISEVNCIGPYLNIKFNTGWLGEVILEGIFKGRFAKKAPVDSETERVFVEYASLNTHKPVHVGHIRNTVLGDSIARLITWSGKVALRAFWLGDEGTHVAKCLWLYKKKGLSISDLGDKPALKLGQLYTEADKLLNLKSYTTLPFPGIIVAKILDIKLHPKNPKWRVLTLSVGNEHEESVVTAALGGKINDKVAYVKPNTRFKGRIITTADKDGVISAGMVCSYAELELNNDESLAILKDDAAVGKSVVEEYRTINDNIPPESDIVLTIQAWEGEISSILQRLESGDPEIKDLWQETRKLSLIDFKNFCSWLNTKFDYEFFESEDGLEGKEIVKSGFNEGIFKLSDGAIGADLNEDKLGFCLLIKSDGTANYATRDIALAKRKFSSYGASESIYVVDYNQTLHFKQVFKCLELLGISKADFNIHVSYGRVILPTGEMSSRKGNVILFSDLVELLIKKITEEHLQKYSESWSKEELEEAAYCIALATIRYGMLQQDNNSQIVFDLNEWCNRSGNTGSYLLYAYARICSIFRESKIESDKLLTYSIDYSLLSTNSEHLLLLHCANFYDSACRASKTHAPNLIATYLYELAKLFSKFYHECSVLKADSLSLQYSRLAICLGVKKIFETGFELLGIKPVEKM